MKVSRFLILAAVSFSASAQSLPDWENPLVLGINKLPYHVTLGNPSTHSSNPQITYLDGTWKFRWSPDPDSRPAGFYENGYDVSAWDDIHVPADWQMQGFGTPIYTNSRLTVQEISYLIAQNWGRSVFLDDALRFSEDDKKRITKGLIEDKQLPVFNKKVKKISYMDGCKVFFDDDSYVICRFSGTEPLLRIMAEASTAEEARVLLETFRMFVERLM